MADRKAALETALADHTARVDLEVEHIGNAVAAFEAEMERFVGRLAAIDEPAAFAAIAATVPEAPSLDVVAAAAHESVRAPLTPDVEAEATEGAGNDDETAEATATADHTQPRDMPDDIADLAVDDPRLAALAMAVAESEAAVDAASEDGAGEPEPPDEVSEDSLAARLASLVPAGPSANGSVPHESPEPAEPAQLEASEATRVVVIGLVNVASIASFKRHLARVRGVASVGVSSGPDGEFVFTATHVPNVSIRDVIPTLPGFAARLTGFAEGVLTVSARDPEQNA
jgi:hypothetical protein